MISQYQNGILILLARTLPPLCHIAYLTFIIKGIISDLSIEGGVFLCLYFILAAIGHTLCLITHWIAFCSEEGLEMNGMAINSYYWGTVASCIPGWSIFGAYTGKIFPTYISTYGFSEWRKLPLLIQIVYFNLWLSLVFIVALLALLPCFEVIDPVVAFFLQKVAKRPRRQPTPAPLVAISTIPPLVAVSDVPPLIS